MKGASRFFNFDPIAWTDADTVVSINREKHRRTVTIFRRKRYGGIIR